MSDPYGSYGPRPEEIPAPAAPPVHPGPPPVGSDPPPSPSPGYPSAPVLPEFPEFPVFPELPEYPAYPSGASGHGAWRPPGALPDRRPGVVTAGAVVAIVMSALAGLLCLVLGAVAMTLEPHELDLADTQEAAALAIAAFLLAALGAAAVVCAAFALARRQGARITTVVLGLVTVVLDVVALLGARGNPVGAVLVLLWLAGTLTAVVLLLLPRSGAWYAARGPATVVPPARPGTPWR